MQETQELAVWPSLTAAAPHPTLSTAAAIHPNTNLGAQTPTQTETHKPKHTDTNLETQAQTNCWYPHLPEASYTSVYLVSHFIRSTIV